MSSIPAPAAHPGAAGAPLRVIGRSRAAALAYQAQAPMLPPPLRTHELIEGRGVVYLGAEPLGEVEYWLKDVEETDKTVFPTGHRADGEPSDARTGSRGLFGFVRATTKENVLGRYVGRPLFVRAADGRALEFTVTKVLTAENSLFHNYLVQGAAPAP